jgi:enoyl-CoA hydratase/carnithine racemase
MSMNDEILLARESKGILFLTLNRPSVMNALNLPMLHSLQQCLQAVRFRADIRVLVITGAGLRAFSVGADLKERSTLNDLQVKEYIFTLGNLFTAIEYFRKPVIAAVNGAALGGGMELSLACDLRIASVNATMALPETRLAVIPGGGGTQRLPRLVGKGKAMELIFTGRSVDAAEALDMGLVNKTCEPKNLMEEAQIMASMICEAGPVALEQAKYAINSGLETDLHTGLAIESNAYVVTIPTEDRKEALSAFLEKRKPRFKGK